MLRTCRLVFCSTDTLLRGVSPLDYYYCGTVVVPYLCRTPQVLTVGVTGTVRIDAQVPIL